MTGKPKRILVIRHAQYKTGVALTPTESSITFVCLEKLPLEDNGITSDNVTIKSSPVMWAWETAWALNKHFRFCNPMTYDNTSYDLFSNGDPTESAIKKLSRLCREGWAKGRETLIIVTHSEICQLLPRQIAADEEWPGDMHDYHGLTNGLGVLLDLETQSWKLVLPN